jgi:mannosyl-oligosaccharide alpha-1,2-mannosidase
VTRGDLHQENVQVDRQQKLPIHLRGRKEGRLGYN